jgi:hypothetical protein
MSKRETLAGVKNNKVKNPAFRLQERNALSQVDAMGIPAPDL